MSKKSESSLIIRQVLDVSLAVVVVFLGGVLDSKLAKREKVEVSNVIAQNQYEEGVVDNLEDDYIHYEQTTYLDKKEILETKENISKKETKIEEKKEKTIVKEKIDEETARTEHKEPATEETPPTEYKEVIEVKATAYCLCKKCCGKSETHPEYGVTASGLKIVPGTNMKVIAVDPNLVPLGTKVYVEGLNGAADYGYAIAADTGSAIKNKKIDLYMDTHAASLKWGVKNVKVYIID